MGKDVVGYNNDGKNVFNSVGSIYGESLTNLGFVKDVDKLAYQYDNLIRKIGSEYARYFPNEEDRKDFFSYVKDAFVSLVLEYDPYSGVDFPGYIIRKLRYRVQYSYINKLNNKKDRVVLLKSNEIDTSDLLDFQRINTDSTSYDKAGTISRIGKFDSIDDSLLMVRDYLEREHPLNDIQEALFRVMSTGTDNAELTIETVHQVFPEATKSEIQSYYLELKNQLLEYYGIKLYITKEKKQGTHQSYYQEQKKWRFI
ncbi:hypothetical protein GPK34_00510 [Secundilactobacillus kimchicus]|uniref:hypothetical protein n=1 Tax=Secundilactobacillus kimchicus TaxID=528209 RepID=UPI001C0341B2|nr:hypothetical protein [Secundilactobacillus kimchicus]MBT9670519.1 hypothetical protein [Secundilactobacillus kimchicus]